MARLVSFRPLLLVAASTGCFGCGGGAADLYPFEGTFLVDGLPASNVMVVFHPVDPSDRLPVISVGVTGPDGTFHVQTRRHADGVAAGEYAVTAVWPDRTIPLDDCVEVTVHDRFQGRYGDPAKSPWHVTIRPGTNAKTFRADMPMTGWTRPKRRDFEPALEK